MILFSEEFGFPGFGYPFVNSEVKTCFNSTNGKFKPILFNRDLMP